MTNLTIPPTDHPEHRRRRANVVFLVGLALTLVMGVPTLHADSIIVCPCGGQLIQVLSGQTCADVCCTSCGKPKPSPATDCNSLCSPITVSSCGTGEDVIRQCIADVFVADPDTGATLADVVSDAHTQLRTLQDRAIDAVLRLHGLPVTAEEQERLRQWGRGDIRAYTYTRLLHIIDTPAADRTADEQKLYDWLTNLVWQRRIDAAQASLGQFRAWRHSVDFATCKWQPPNTIVWQPRNTIGRGTPIVGDCDNVVNQASASPFDNCPVSGCGPGLLSCFDFPGFTYDPGTASRCAGVPGTITSAFTLGAGVPTYDEFKAYGTALANRQFLDPSVTAVATSADLAVGFGVALGIGALAAGIAAVVADLGAAAVGTSFASAVFPFAAGAAAAAEGVAAIAGTVFIAIVGIVLGVFAIIQVVTYDALVDNLKNDVRGAATTPDLRSLNATASGRQEVNLAFISANAPEPLVVQTPAPPPGTDLQWAVSDEHGTRIPGESGPTLTFTRWDGVPGSAGLFENGWFVGRVAALDPTMENAFALGIQYRKPNGEKWTAWRAMCAATSATCEPGEPVFVLAHNGDDPAGHEGDDAWVGGLATEIAYQNARGESRIARVHRPPLARCQSATTYTDAGRCTALASIDDHSSDPDGENVTLSQDPPGPYGKGVSPITLTVTDDLGLTASCQASVTVLDNQAPPLTCPQSFVTECAGSKTTVTYPPPNLGNDNCGMAIDLGCSPLSGASFELGPLQQVTCMAKDDSENRNQCQFSFRVVDTQAPMTSCPVPQILECTGSHQATATYQATATDTCAGTLQPQCAPLSGTPFSLGTTPVTCSASDPTGNTNQCTSSVKVVDTAPPVVTCAVSASILSNPFPPNHNLVNVGLTATASDLCDGPLPVVVRVFGNEDDQTPTSRTDPVYSPDATGLAPGTLRLRQERLESGKGRVYLIVSTAQDASGNKGVACCTVSVPHDLKATSLNSIASQAAAARSACVAGHGTPPAGYFVIGDGPVIGAKQ